MAKGAWAEGVVEGNNDVETQKESWDSTHGSFGRRCPCGTSVPRESEVGTGCQGTERRTEGARVFPETRGTGGVGSLGGTTLCC